MMENVHASARYFERQKGNYAGFSVHTEYGVDGPKWSLEIDAVSVDVRYTSTAGVERSMSAPSQIFKSAKEAMDTAINELAAYDPEAAEVCKKLIGAKCGRLRELVNGAHRVVTPKQSFVALQRNVVVNVREITGITIRYRGEEAFVLGSESIPLDTPVELIVQTIGRRVGVNEVFVDKTTGEELDLPQLVDRIKKSQSVLAWE